MKTNIVLSLLLVICVSILIGTGYFFASMKIKDVQAKWDAVEFAMSEEGYPLTMATKQAYASKSAELRDSFLKKEPTQTEQFLEKVNEKLSDTAADASKK